MARTHRPIRALGVRLTLGAGVAVALFAMTGGNSGYQAAGSAPGAGAASRASIAGHQVKLVDDEMDSCGGDDNPCDGGGGDNGGGDNGGSGGTGTWGDGGGGSSQFVDYNGVSYGLSGAVEGSGYDGTAEPQYVYERGVTAGEAAYDGYTLMHMGMTTGYAVSADANGDGGYSLNLNQY